MDLNETLRTIMATQKSFQDRPYFDEISAGRNPEPYRPQVSPNDPITGFQGGPSNNAAEVSNALAVRGRSPEYAPAVQNYYASNAPSLPQAWATYQGEQQPSYPTQWPEQPAAQMGDVGLQNIMNYQGGPEQAQAQEQAQGGSLLAQLARFLLQTQGNAVGQLMGAGQAPWRERLYPNIGGPLTYDRGRNPFF